ncbi:hypothetical protein GILI108418_04275 [Gillisia limnaea]|uniref:Uncharacterized protein n=1 Tax=Gillisia limnaea (strain DSM 15749 / LMG 21470 / R-8282) TaxID=865937 RepID=H2BVB3_GILLR|nr:hypothetical protein Gilli_1104 [Gillisia limnaea DSM 15749]
MTLKEIKIYLQNRDNYTKEERKIIREKLLKSINN